MWSANTTLNTGNGMRRGGLFMPWNPEQYLRFKAERFAPFDDLVKLIKVRPGLRVVDLGCGP